MIDQRRLVIVASHRHHLGDKKRVHSGGNGLRHPAIQVGQSAFDERRTRYERLRLQAFQPVARV